MSGFALLQALVIGAVVAFSAWYAFRKLLPQTSQRLLAATAATLDRPTRPALVRRIGRRLQPPAVSSGACGGGDGCSACAGCALAKDATPPPGSLPPPSHPSP
jgi:predicted lipid-binding transport protein (Tim44 family)